MSDENQTNEPLDEKDLEIKEFPKETLQALDELIKESVANSSANESKNAESKEESEAKDEIEAKEDIEGKEESKTKVEPKPEEKLEPKERHKPDQKKKKPQQKAKVKEERSKDQFLPNFPYSFKTVVLVLGFAALLIFMWSIIFHPAMRIDEITVNGNYEYSDEEILDALGLQVGDHIWTFTGSNRRALIRSTPYIQNIQVTVDFPSHVVINVTERHKLAYIKTPDGYIAIDAQGLVLEFVPLNEDVSPVLCGLDVDNAVLGRTIEITDTLPFRKLILVLGAILDADNSSIHHDNYSFFDSVQEVRIVPSGMIFVTVLLPDGTMLQVKLAGIEDIAENMQWLLYSIKGGAFDDLPAGSLDMTQEEKIYHAYDI